MLTANTAIREKMKAEKITVWQVAEIIGVHEKTLNGWFRTELDGEKKEKVEKAIKKIERSRR